MAAEDKRKMGKAMTGSSLGPRIMVVQFGDYQQALLARQAKLPETYRAQYYSMACVEKILHRGKALVVCLDTAPYDVIWDHFHLVGGRFVPVGNGGRYLWRAWCAGRQLIAMATSFAPSHIIVRTPDWPMIFLGSWALRKKIHLLPLFADYFYSDTLKNRLRNLPLLKILNHPDVHLVANHNYPACTSMARAGVTGAKIVPYDWPPGNDPRGVTPKELVSRDQPLRLCYAGSVAEQKGVGDLLAAVASLVRSGMNIELDIFGTGPEKTAFEALAHDLTLSPRVRFHGLAANTEVLAAMSKAHLVVVPSRHAYPEGIPCVIYESLETRTPVVISDHPSFIPKLTDGCGVLIFPAASVDNLASCIKRALTDPSLYAELSRGTVEAWDNIQCPITFGQLLEDWLAVTTGRGNLPYLGVF
jgi:glycosyltransferase involved in cell wall biosynthesis